MRAGAAGVVAERLGLAIGEVAGDPARCARSPGRDFTRNRKIGLAALLGFLVAMGTGTLGRELLLAWGMSPEAPSASALCQQWAKLADGVMRRLLRAFLSRFEVEPYLGRYRLLAADGTDMHVAPDPSDARTRMPAARGSGGHNEVHATCAFDVLRRTFEDMAFRGGREQDEPAELCELVDRLWCGAGLVPLWLGDRNYCTYNVICHMLEAGASFVLRAKGSWALRALEARGPGAPAPAPGAAVDERVSLCVVRSRAPSARTRPGEPWLYRHVPAGRRFDALAPGSRGEYWMDLRVVRVPREGEGLWLVTDLPESEFPPEALAGLYAMRWGIEVAFDELKHAAGLEFPHVRSYERIEQETWARLVRHAVGSLTAALLPDPPDGRVHPRATDRSAVFALAFDALAGRACDVEAVAARHAHPVRPGRSFRRRRRPPAPPSFTRR